MEDTSLFAKNLRFLIKSKDINNSKLERDMVLFCDLIGHIVTFLTTIAWKKHKQWKKKHANLKTKTGLFTN